MLLKRFTALIVLVSLAIFGFAQSSDTTFNRRWKEIDSLISIQNLPKSALQKVNDLYDMASQKGLAAQQIKCLVYRINLEANTAENDPSRRIGILDSALQVTKDAAVRGLLEGLMAYEYKT